MSADAFSELDPDAQRQLRRMARIHRICSHVFWVGMLLVFGGGLLALTAGEWAISLFVVGFAIWGILILSVFIVYPRLRCPNCGHRFFLPDNFILRQFAKVEMLQKACLHCGLPLRPSKSTTE